MDKHGANEKGTNKLREDDKKTGRKRLAINCDVHPSSSVMTKTWKLGDVHISGLLAWSLAERGPGRFDELREMLGEECVQMLRINRRPFFSRKIAPLEGQTKYIKVFDLPPLQAHRFLSAPFFNLAT